MSIHFRCRRCRNALSVAMRQAGCPMICTVCRSEIVVPSASEMAPPAGGPVAGEPVSLAAGAPNQTPVAHAPGSPSGARKRLTRRALIAGSVGALVLVAAGWMTNRVWSKWRQPAASDIALLEESDSDDALADIDLPPAPIATEDQAEVAAPKARLASNLKEEEETVQGAWSRMPPRPVKAENVKNESPSTANLVIKRRRAFSEEELRKQLLWAPEVGLKPVDVQPLVENFTANLATARERRTEPSLEPGHILRQRPDFKMLPYRRGLANRIDRNVTEELQHLGQELRLLLDRLAGKNGESQTSLVLLGEFLKSEVRRDDKSTWLRPEAVPTLQQILGHEDLPVRLLLVDVLSRIEGRASSTALVQRAVFDLSSEVRDAAVASLDHRPREEYRSALVAALRYPWAPAADHAAEAIAALKDQAAAPQLVKLLNETDPADPVAKKDKLWKREVVRLNHKDNCLACHSLAVGGADPVPGAVPGVARVGQSAIPISTLLSGAPLVQASGYPYRPQEATSLIVRADITYLRQDFSVQLPVLVQQPADFVNLRFDYVVRFRPLTDSQAHEWKAQANRPESYEQREAVLFALRELTGKDFGTTADAWEKMYPMSEFEAWTNELTNALVNAPDLKKLAVIKKLRDAKGVAYTEALAQAIPQLAEAYQPKARAALVERMKRMSLATLRDKLADENREIRLAAASAAGSKQESALIPDLTALLEDAEPAVAEAAQAALKSLKGREAKANGGGE
jgi:HEAT repeat protein